jgi:outer membrane protein TolC
VTTSANAFQTNSAGYGFTLSKQMHSGIIVEPTVSVQRSAAEGWLRPSNAADASLSITVPILRNRGGSVSAAQLQAAEARYSAEEHALRHGAAASVLDAVSAYWNDLAAEQTFEIRVAAEQRAERLVNEMQVLVAAKERAGSDLSQAQGNRASKSVLRLTAEQARDEARQRLALRMNVDPANTLLLPPPAVDGFPAPPSAAFLSDSSHDAALAAVALANRADLAGQREIRRSVTIGVGAAEAAARPGLDVLFSIGYAGLQTSNGVNGFFSPLYRGIPGVNASVRIDYQLPLSNAVGRGATLQQTAALRQVDVEFESLQREAMLSAPLAARNTRRRAQALSEAADAVARYRAVAASEKEKLRLGLSTLTEVILAEDALTNALLVEVTSRSTYAVAIVTLRYVTGTLIDHSNAELSVDVAKLLTPQ